MKKKLLALAIAGAFAVPAASAMADSGNVTIYGQMRMSYDLVNPGYANNTANGNVDSHNVNKVSDNSSRLGFKGTEDLGNGLSAIWQIESAIHADGDTSTLAGRNTFVGLSGKSWGTVLLGRHDTPYKMATRSLDVFNATIADNRSILGEGYANFDGRQRNVLAYVTPNMNGFTGMIAYVAGGETAYQSSQDKGNAWSLAGVYKNGPWFGSLAYEKHNLGAFGTGTVASPSATLPNLSNKDEHAWKLGLGYKWQAFKLGFVYEDTKDNFGGTTGANGYVNPKNSSDVFGHHAYSFNGAYAFSNNALKVAYTQSGDAGGWDNSGAKMWTVGIDHHFSKRTTIYALYTKLTNDTNNASEIGGRGASTGGIVSDASINPATGALSGASLDSSPSAFSFGINHKF